MKLSVIGGNYSKYSGSTVGNIQEASKSWPTQPRDGLGIAATEREHNGNPWSPGRCCPSVTTKQNVPLGAPMLGHHPTTPPCHCPDYR